jgi:hypothetical protein
MKNLISKATAQINSLLSAFQVKRFLAVALVGFLLLTTNVNTGRNTQAVAERALDKAHQSDSVRPKTTNEWKQDARETDNSPGERLQKIADQSGAALKEFGSLYPETAKSTASDRDS